MTEALELEISVPEILAPLYEPRRYKVMHGGRGGGKSHTVAQVLLEMGTREQLRILCAREIQKSMRDSVHRLLKDYIVKLGLTAFYEVLDTEIRGVNGTLFLFAGLQSHTVDSIKSFEGVDRVWIEEAHAISKKSLDTLIPTIRKDGSEIWMTLNPDMETDEVYQRFIATPSPDTWVCQVNWRDNPWFPQVLEEERQKAKRSMLADDYAHIWEGKARRVAAGAIYRHEIEHLYADNRAGRVPYDPRIPVHTVWDLGWNDSMTIAMVQVGPQDVRVIDYIEDSHRTYDWYVTQLEKRPYRWGTDYLPHDGKTKNAQTGKNAEMVLKELGRSRVVCLSALDVEEGIKSARMMFPRCYFDSAKTARLLECLKRYQRAIHTSTGEAMGPLHDEFSHGADCFRYLSQAAEHMLRSQQQKPLAPVGGGWAPLDREIGY
ncbi:PBSX family phage terminase large subunit [Acidovorax sp. SD340]|jgi:phage terminase large subunit|uniref:PBSX family phage terminase large subunit n=1 Tax=Acidovorax sp. SD340 TaxID=1690268 RepID=UPI0006DC1F35|nr:PBSX family phage terminase large subunit [Acidovorax sp. SD340]KQB59356.1 terminase [Acidovorax sp. SD340]MBO1007103.1 PBSX family phage terminase large subunit [Acidovorax sp. SD340]